MADDEAASLEDILAGKQNGEHGAALSVDANSHARIAQLLGPLMHDLDKASVFKALLKHDEQFDADVAREMWRLDRPEAGEPTGNKLATETARILSEHQDTVQLLLPVFPQIFFISFQSFH
ncbi:hypothetical protein NQF86_02890 [Bombella sp. TMW 2.2543]|uniref:Uncharacterized protein n=1 Tax=Bombella pluederhausensis TaxID=2967336 RepID=A0ABT3WEW4_9PROT|nr:hypothetical protein [Bombella pluederhausensis]MCX5617619.1 hypothetical protein [Bombella pluederhausensis]